MTTLDPDRRPPARVRAWAWYGALGVLLVLTSLALASVKVWLVLPYLALMAVILFTPPGRRGREGDHRGGSELEARPGPGVESADGRSAAQIEDEAVADASADPASVLEPAEVPGPDSEPREVKTKRGKGRGRKAKAVAESPGSTATWIQIGPGKFVRAESPGLPVAAASPTSEGEPEAPAVLAPDETAGDAPVLWHDEGNLEHGPGPDLTVGSAAAVDAAFASPDDAPPTPGDLNDLFVSLSGIGERSEGAFAPGEESEAVPTAEESSASGEATDVWDPASPDDLTDQESAVMQAGGDPEHAWQPDLEAESAGVVVLGSYPDPDAPPLADSGYGAGEREGEFAVERARDARDQALEEIAGAWAAAEKTDAALGMDATSEDAPDGDAARDNGIAPDAFGPIPPADSEDASTQDRGEVADAPAIPVDRPNRRTVGTLLASLRGLRPRVGPATATRSRPGVTSPGRVVRSARRIRVSPILRPPSRRGPGRSRPACRTFPPRSPPILAGRS